MFSHIFVSVKDFDRALNFYSAVMSKVTALSVELGANPSVTEQVYRAMISGFINAELAEHAALQGNG